MLKLMYITNSPEIAKIAENNGVDRIFIDMEYIGKEARQGGMDTIKNHHTIKDVDRVARVLTHADVLVRVNPIHDATEEYFSSKEEIDGAISAGADIVMLPYFKTVNEVETFVKLVDKRAKTMLLVETPEAVSVLDDILNVDGIDEVHIGLNDLSLGYGMKFMFQLLADGTVEALCDKLKKKGLPYGFGGIASLGKGMLSSEKVIAEHYRLGSQMAILSRSFCNANLIDDVDEIKKIFDVGVKEVRDWEKKCENGLVDFDENKKEVKILVSKIVEGLERK